MRMVPRAVAAMLSGLLHLLILSFLVHVATGLVEPRQPSNLEATADKLRGAGDQYDEW